MDTGAHTLWEQAPLPVNHILGEGRGNEEDDSDGEDEEDSGEIYHSPDWQFLWTNQQQGRAFPC